MSSGFGSLESGWFVRRISGPVDDPMRNRKSGRGAQGLVNYAEALAHLDETLHRPGSARRGATRGGQIWPLQMPECVLVWSNPQLARRAYVACAPPGVVRFRRISPVAAHSGDRLLLNPQPALSLVGGNRSLCPIAAIRVSRSIRHRLLEDARAGFGRGGASLAGMLWHCDVRTGGAAQRSLPACSFSSAPQSSLRANP